MDFGEQRFHDQLYAEDFRAIRESHILRHRLGAMIEFLLAETKRGSSVFSLGCGDGELETRVAGALGHVTGMDVSAVAIEQARVNAEQRGAANTEFIVGDCLEPEGLIPGQKFDAIWAIGFLHHIPAARTTELLSNLRRHLKPDGIMISDDPSNRRLVSLLKPLVTRAYERYHSPDEREVSVQEMTQLYEGAGCRVLRVHYYDFAAGPLGWIWPTMPAPLAWTVWQADRAIRLIPILRPYSSSFMMVAGR